MSDRASNYERWREAEAARLLSSGRADADTVRELLILACHSSPSARQFFEDRLGNKELLVVLLGLAIEDYSADAQMTAAYWASRFSPTLLSEHIPALRAVAANEWGSVAVHAQRALDAVRVMDGSSGDQA